ncbi:hypothetical protein FBU59_004348 [Linderina macrospora]|uniref:Uncharacterized protein n=1 Tax=Linderina macrospora TaxID=4868 RepID=A0ACC1J5N5_9FUNG|nr:hypothetical protein FBU59_004348 [Linderina macrospora]
MSQQDNNIKVIARFRPPNSLEKKSGSTSVIDIEDESTVAIKVSQHTRNEKTHGLAQPWARSPTAPAEMYLLNLFALILL